VLSAATPELGALVPGAAQAVWIVVGVFGVVVVGDALLARGSLKGYTAELPGLVRMTKEREGLVDVTIRNEFLRGKPVRIGLALPAEFESPRDTMTVAPSTATTASRVTWPCKPMRRGNYELDAVYLEGLSPLGLWGVRTKSPAQAEIRVYPNLFKERKHLAALFLNWGSFGVHAQRQVGKGRDFEKLREYMPGDSFDEIHWKATAKRGHPITKVYQLERTQEVYVILDASRLSGRMMPDLDGGGETTQLERFLNAALILGLAAERQGDLFGLLTFSDRVERFVRAKNGKAHYGACRDALYTLHPRTVTPDFDEMGTFVRTQLRRRALLVFLTNLDDPVLAESFTRTMDMIRRQHLVLVNMVTPPGVRPLFSSAGMRSGGTADSAPVVESVDDVYARLGGHIRWHGLRELERVLYRKGVTFTMLQHASLSAELVSQYMAIKQRQML
jgi:uncharacterized protein (DUF58 family)